MILKNEVQYCRWMLSTNPEWNQTSPNQVCIFTLWSKSSKRCEYDWTELWIQPLGDEVGLTLYVAEPRGCGRMSSRWLQSDLRVQRYGSSESKDRFFQSWLSNFWKTLCSCSSPTLAYIVGWCLTCKWTYTALYFSMYPIQTKKRIGLEILHRPQSNLDLSLRSPSGSSCERLVSRWVYLKGCWSVWTFF